MKRASLILFLLSSTLFAQEANKKPGLLLAATQPVNVKSQPANARSQPVTFLDDNYEIILKMTDKEGEPIEMALMTASQEFSSSLGEQNLSFSGILTVGEDGWVTVMYTLDWTAPMNPASALQAGMPPQTIRYQTSSTKGSIRLKDGEELQILRAGSRKASLSVKKWVTSK